PDLLLQIAHVLLVDVVGYSKLLVNEQIELLQELNQIVRGTESFRAADASGKLTRVPTGDGMALLFFHSPEEPVRCALEISKALRQHPRIQLRMGIHSGPVNKVRDVNDKTNFHGSPNCYSSLAEDCCYFAAVCDRCCYQFFDHFPSSNVADVYINYSRGDS